MEKFSCVICEYNPFHLGHEAQIRRFRERFPDRGIVCLMTGNLTERAEFALFDKRIRAKAAVLGGADLVLELPLPFASAGAQTFADGGVALAEAIGADELFFGVEKENETSLDEKARVLNSTAFAEDFERERKETKDVSYARVRTQVAARHRITLPETPNDILALSYVCAIQKREKLTPIPMIREGAGYFDDEECGIMSASGIRKAFAERNELRSVPDAAKRVYEEAIARGEVYDEDKLGPILLSHFRLSDPASIAQYAEMNESLAHRIVTASRESVGFDEFKDRIATKQYPATKLRRALINSVLRIPIRGIDEEPAYAQLLAANEKGCAILRQIDRASAVPILTKPADVCTLSETAQAQFALGSRADALFALCLRSPLPAAFSVTRNPEIVKKGENK